MFRGTYEHTVDQKGRLSIPSKFREILRDHFSEMLIITRSDGCLVAYTEDEWQRLERKISELPQLKANVTDVQRYIIASASDCPVDKQGRILIPQYLREHAEIARDVILAGMTNKIEIWSKERWQEKMNKTSGEYGKIVETLGI